jgi:hypothetical protein
MPGKLASGQITAQRLRRGLDAKAVAPRDLYYFKAEVVGALFEPSRVFPGQPLGFPCSRTPNAK